MYMVFNIHVSSLSPTIQMWDISYMQMYIHSFAHILLLLFPLSYKLQTSKLSRSSYMYDYLKHK